MKISRTNHYPTRRRNPLAVPLIVGAVLLVAFLAWMWARGGEQPQHHVEKPIPAERLGH